MLTTSELLTGRSGGKVIKEYHTKTGKLIRLIRGDCMELMSDKDENFWDLCISDPPYGINYEDGGQYFNKHKGKKWDSGIPDDGFFSALFSVSMNQIIWGGNYFRLPPTRGIIAWTKTVELQNRTFSEFELAWSSFDLRARWIDLKPFQRNGSRVHPTQKPVKLYRWLLQNYAKEGDRILDTHGGSMSHAIACWEEDFELDIIELDEDYYKASVKRFEQHISQTALF